MNTDFPNAAQIDPQEPLTGNTEIVSEIFFV